jgi:TldD protein
MKLSKSKSKNQKKGVSRRDFLLLSTTATTAGVFLSTGCKKKKPEATTPMKPQITEPLVTLARFGVSQELARKVMAKALSKGGTYSDLYFQKTRMVMLGLEDSAVNKAYTNIDMGVGIRVVNGNQTGYAFTESLDEQSMMAAAEIASSVASGKATSTPKSFKAGKFNKYYPTTSIWEGVNPTTKVKILTDIEEKVRAKDKRIKKVLITFSNSESEILHMDSLGRQFSDFLPMTTTRVSCVAEENGKIESNGFNTSGRAGLDFYSEKKLNRIASEAVRRTVVLFKAVPGPVGEMPIVLSPGSSGILLHEAIGHGMEADFARKKITIFTDKIGKRIAPKFVNIFDDGTNMGMRGSINSDDEGNGSFKTQLVENGIFKTFLHDMISAKHFKVKPTGNGRRQSFRHMPVPRMRNTYMTNGPHNPDEIIKTIKKGIYAETFTNGQVMIGAGDFTFYVKTGYLIEDGKITAPIKDVNIIGNGPDVLADIKMVGNDFVMDDGGWTCGKSGQGVPVGLGMPTIKVGKITVGGTAKSKKTGKIEDYSNQEATT